MFDFVYDWVIHVVPKWLWWVLMTPLILVLGFILIEYLRPGTIFGNGG